MRVLLIPLLLSLYAGCANENADNSGMDDSATQPVTVDPMRERDRVQKPEVVLGFMGNNGDLTGLTIADLFADDGYWTFKMIDRGANVIAVVNDQAKAEAIIKRKKERNLSDDRLQVRTVLHGDPGIANAEVDMALIAHRFVSIRDKPDYFRRMRMGMRPPRYLVMVEWRYEQTATGPPMDERMSENDIMDFIGTTGYADVGAHSAQIPDQVVYLINDYIDMPVEGAPTE